jgi:hypothetical protein
MSDKFRDLTSHLRWLTLWIRHAGDQADARLREVNHLIGQLAVTGFLLETVLLGPVIHRRHYAPRPGGSDSGQVAQAALCVPGGVGVVLWDSEDYCQLRETAEGLESEALLHFRPLGECELALKALLQPHIEPLLGRLYRLLA